MHRYLQIAAALAATLAFPIAASASAVLLATDFEAPTYTAGALSGQNGWQGGSGPQYPVVQSDFARTGQQAVRIDAISGNGQFLVGHGLNYSAVGNPNQVVRFQVDAYVESTANAYFDIFAIAGNSGFLGQLLTLPGGGITLSGTHFASFALDQWHNFAMEMDFENLTESAWVDGQLIGTRPMESLTSTGFGTLLVGRQSGDGTRSFFMDNLSVVAFERVPEPGSLALAGLGLGLFGWQRRRQR